MSANKSMMREKISKKLRDAYREGRRSNAVYIELDDATKGHLRWDARAALRAMGYEVKG